MATAWTEGRRRAGPTRVRRVGRSILSRRGAPREGRSRATPGTIELRPNGCGARALGASRGQGPANAAADPPTATQRAQVPRPGHPAADPTPPNATQRGPVRDPVPTPPGPPRPTPAPRHPPSDRTRPGARGGSKFWVRWVRCAALGRPPPGRRWVSPTAPGSVGWRRRGRLGVCWLAAAGPCGPPTPQARPAAPRHHPHAPGGGPSTGRAPGRAVETGGGPAGAPPAPRSTEVGVFFWEEWVLSFGGSRIRPPAAGRSRFIHTAQPPSPHWRLG